jgi:hypothetical protein
MTTRIHISVPIYNRPELARQCVPTITEGMDDGDALVLYDDGSTECGADFWAHMEGVRDGVVRTESMGIDAQRRKHILEFWGNREIHGCTHLALIDSDIICDPGWRDAAISLLEKYHAPVCLYRTKTHEDYKNNVFRDHPGEEVIWQRFAPGVFYFLSLEMVGRVAHLIPEKWAWDWHLPGLFNYRMAVSRVSHVDHIGLNGLHDRHPSGHVSTERALNPTDWLVRKRAEVLSMLNLKEHE